jgi:dipeptidyl aminopeptidase/acylaminoacyl peptidase
LPADPRRVLMQIRMPGSTQPGVYHVDVLTGALKAVLRGEAGIFEWIPDASGAIRVGSGTNSSHHKVTARKQASGRFRTIADFHVTKKKGLYFAGYTEKLDTILVRARRPRPGDPEGDRLAVYEYSIRARKFGKLVFGHEKVDVTGAIVYAPGTDRPVAIEYLLDGPELHFLDEERKALHGKIDRSLPNRTNRVFDSAKNGEILLIESSSPSTPPELHIAMVESGRFSKLLSIYPELEGVELAEPKAIRYAARDGLMIDGILTLPPGSNGASLPAIVLPHGGPMERDFLQFDRDVLFLASRGFAVLQMNFRGSAGYGFRREAAGHKKWGLEMQDDIADGAKWLIEQGIADPDRLGIYGASYGGYAALMASVKTPKLFRCAASYAGLFDLVAENEHDSHYVGGKIAEQFRGDDPKALKAASPFFAVDRIRIPILLGHGEDDSNVPFSQSTRMAKALREAGKDVELMLFPGEIHGFDRADNAMEFIGRLERFFALHLAPENPPLLGK